jgi:hypothetical protein
MQLECGETSLKFARLISERCEVSGLDSALSMSHHVKVEMAVGRMRSGQLAPAGLPIAAWPPRLKHLQAEF